MRFLAAIAVILAGLMTAACSQSSAATEASRTDAPTVTPARPAPTASRTQTPLPTATNTVTPAPTATPSSTPTAAPSPTPSPTPAAQLMQLTTGGCCAQPFFSPDSRQVLFIDKPAADAPVGIYGVNLSDTLPAKPQLIEQTIGFRSPDRSIVIEIEGDLALFTNETTGQSWQVDTGGNRPTFSPDGTKIVWVATDREGPYDQRRSDIWLANLDGSQARRVYILYGGGFAGWFPDGERLLLTGRDTPSAERVTLLAYNPATGDAVPLASHKRIRGLAMSPQGDRLVYYVYFADDDPADRGYWLLNSDGSNRQKLELPWIGAYRWRNDDTLIFIPLRETAADSMQVWSVDVATGQTTPLTDPAKLSFSISNGDWDISPDGNTLVFVNSADQNIWAIALP